ncbi:hypothetical protein KGM_215994 [Danaus plexippus plexippus]|uniref:Uncharacterized protein n=1 Tax=Danaus plexippus plexippus TaxID=278856 RepID=A0A212FLG7_DANPL|nr:hypothetical protein KGM_215994 [Danaus plexippus plexippus]
MAALETVLFIIVIVFQIIGNSIANSTAQIPDTAVPKEYKPSGTLASFGRMVVDLPLGLVEAFKDGAEAIESVILGIVRTIFT